MEKGTALVGLWKAWLMETLKEVGSFLLALYVKRCRDSLILTFFETSIGAEVLSVTSMP